MSNTNKIQIKNKKYTKLLTVKDFKNLLESFDDSLPVIFSSLDSDGNRTYSEEGIWTEDIRTESFASFNLEISRVSFAGGKPENVVVLRLYP